MREGVREREREGERGKGREREPCKREKGKTEMHLEIIHRI